jgi:hypothetical protein
VRAHTKIIRRKSVKVLYVDAVGAARSGNSMKKRPRREPRKNLPSTAAAARLCSHSVQLADTHLTSKSVPHSGYTMTLGS